jgi:hypothetical protein
VIGNDLLRWMSARGSGSWAQFRAAVDRLTREIAGADYDGDRDDLDASRLSLYQQLRLNFERLGFAEFFGDEEKWRVAPPVLVTGQFGARQAALLCGARSDDLLRRIELAAPQLIREEPQENCPDSLFIETESPVLLTQIAASAGLSLQAEAPTVILSAIPALGTDLLRSLVEPPLGKDWGFERFRERDLRWETATRGEMERSSHGLFRLRFRHRTEFLLRWAGRTLQTRPQEAKFLLLRRVRKHVLAYDQQGATLTVPAICRPPLLIDRALHLCSGRLAAFEVRDGAGSLLYKNVSSAVATTAASLLRQRLL